MSSATSTAATPAPEGRVRLRRFGTMAVPALALGGTLVVLTAQGALAAQFAISGIPFTVTADQLQGTGFEQYGSIDNAAPGSPNLRGSNGQQVVMVSAIKSATLTNLCQSVQLGGFYLVIRAGSGSTPVAADNLLVDSSALSGNAAFTNINIGEDASKLTEVPGATGPLGDFAQQADSVTINHLRQTNWATTASSFSLPGLDMSFSSTGC